MGWIHTISATTAGIMLGAGKIFAESRHALRSHVANAAYQMCTTENAADQMCIRILLYAADQIPRVLVPLENCQRGLAVSILFELWKHPRQSCDSSCHFVSEGTHVCCKVVRHSLRN